MISKDLALISAPDPSRSCRIGPVRRESATVVVIVGEVTAALLGELRQVPNVAVVARPDAAADQLRAAIEALRDAARRASPYVLVPADPLAAVAAEWAAMWDSGAGPRGAAGFETRAAEALAAWRAGQFELPDYYLVLTGPRPEPDGPAASLHLGPIRAVRPRRVAVAPVTDAPGRPGRVIEAIGSLAHGPWWPPLDEIIDAARRFYAGGLAESQDLPGAAR
jgi:hypothetical protein